MASQSVDLQQVQAQLLESFDKIQSLSVEIAAMNTKMDLLNTDCISKDQQVTNLMSANRQLSDEGDGAKKFEGQLDSPFRAWAKAVRRYCNGSKPGFREYLRWPHLQLQLPLIRLYSSLHLHRHPLRTIRFRLRRKRYRRNQSPRNRSL